MLCPNCGVDLGPLKSCPECEHVDGDVNCECETCNLDIDLDDDWEDEDFWDDDFDEDKEG